MLQLLRYALRQLRNSPGFALTAVLTLALGIGATTAIFGILDAVLLQPLPFPHPDRLVAIGTVPYEVVSFPTVHDWQARSRTFQSVAAYRGWSPTVKSSRGSEVGNVVEVSQNFFSTLGASFALGQDLPQTGNERDCTSQAIVSGAYWKKLGGGSTLGARTLEINRRTYQITGVLLLSQPIEGSGSLNHPEIFVPTSCDPWAFTDHRDLFNYWAIGRLRAGVTLSQASADLARVQNTLQHDYPDVYSGPFARPPALTSWITELTGANTRPALLATLAGCALLLVIACANLANLLLARNTKRRHEFATRAALGASLGHLLRQLLVESSLLAFAGTAGGVVIAFAAIRLLQHARALQLPRLAHATLSPVVLLFAIFVSVAVTILLTLLPAWRTLRPSLLRDISGGGRTSGSSSLRVAGRLLVTAQVTLTVVLVACAGWMISSVVTLLHQPLGFDPSHLLLEQVDIDATSVTPTYDRVRTNLWFTQLIARLRQLPGVVAVGATNHPPLGSAINQFNFATDQHPEHYQRPVASNPNSYHVSPGYFSTIGQTVLAGRDFTAADDGSRHVAIVNRTLAEREWPGQSAIGRRVHTGDIVNWATVVGVVADVHSLNLDSAPIPDLYLPEADLPPTAMYVVLRTAGDPHLLTHAVRDIIRAGHPDLAIYNQQTMSEIMSTQVALRSFLMQLAAAFGALALFLAILGTYGLLAYEVSLREKEIGIRLALGSSREAIVRLLLGQESRWVLLGTAAGVFAAALTGYALRAQFYHARAASLPVLAASAALLMLPALIAIALPARRAAHLDLVQTLRSE